MINNIKDFYQWEKISRDTIDVKRIYIDIAGDLVAGILLSQIIYWFLPGEKGSKVKVNKDSRMWLAKKREDWWNECRISPKQFDRAIKILSDKELVITKNYKFNGFKNLIRKMNFRDSLDMSQKMSADHSVCYNESD